MLDASLSEWPTLRTYAGEYVRRIALPLGGIGTGTVSLGGRGDLRDWELCDRPAKGFTPDVAFLALRTQRSGERPVVRAVEGPIDTSEYEGAFGSPAHNHGLPRFRECSFETAYPFGEVVLTDPDVPVGVRLQAFNPLVPTDSAASGIPVAVLRLRLTNDGGEPVQVSACASLQNFIGNDGSDSLARGNVNVFRRDEHLSGLFMTSAEVPPDAAQWGSLALTVLDGHDVTHRTGWADFTWGDALLDFWDDFSDDGRLQDRVSNSPTPIASLAENRVLEPHHTTDVTFLLTWHFPNRRAWEHSPAEADDDLNHTGPVVGNHYATQYANAWQAAVRTTDALPDLEERTARFVTEFCSSDLPDVVQEAALFNLSTLRSQTCFRTDDGRFYGWEGCGDRTGSCLGSCTHVWNYEQATAFLFGDLSRSMREIEFAHATDESGLMSFRVLLPLKRARQWNLAAADGQLGCLVKLYRDWRLSGDDSLLRELWPKARKALEFCWIPGGWDADRDGVMEGCQHNTMDVEYFGPNPQMGVWYLAALRSCEEMARYLGDTEFAAECRRLYENGRRWTDEHLFNGEYYRHEIRPLDQALIADGLRHESMGAQDLANPAFQLGDGCLVDQLVGQYMAHLTGLGHVLDPAHILSTLSSILRYNHKAGFHGHFNHMRSFVLGDESALLMASYPRGNRPSRPFPYFTEVMTGFEYTAAVGMIQEGLTDEGISVITDVRDRYDGRKRNPFNEAECGHHYARAMASWGAVLAYTGFDYDAITGTLRFRAVSTPTRFFWSTGDAWGTCTLTPQGHTVDAKVEVIEGSINVSALQLGNDAATLSTQVTLQRGDTVAVSVAPGG